MFFQKEYVREGASMTLNSTYQLDLPENGLLSGLLLRVSGNQISGLGLGGGSWRIVDFISKIDILIDGATICKSLAGDAVQSIALLDQGVTAPDTWRNYATNTQFAYFLINFGRKLADTEIGLDLSKFNNVQLQVTNTATSSEFNNLDISVQAIYLRNAAGAGFSGYMRTEEWRKWTTVQDETQYLDLPTEGILRRILLQAIPSVDANNVEQTGMENLANDIELLLDTGVIRVYKGGIDDLLRQNLYEYGRPIITGGYPYVNADKGFSMGLGYTLFGAAGAGSQSGAGSSTIPTIESGRTSFTQKAETYEADQPLAAIFSGLAYHNIGVFRFDYLDEINTWLDPNARKTVKLNVHTRNISAAASGTNKVILDRYISYV